MERHGEEPQPRRLSVARFIPVAEQRSRSRKKRKKYRAIYSVASGKAYTFPGRLKYESQRYGPWVSGQKFLGSPGIMTNCRKNRRFETDLFGYSYEEGNQDCGEFVNMDYKSLSARVPRMWEARCCMQAAAREQGSTRQAAPGTGPGETNGHVQ